MSTSLLKHNDDPEKSAYTRRTRVSSSSNDDEDDKINQLFPKCKPRLASSPSEEISSKSMDFNANRGININRSRGRSNNKCLNKHDVNNSNTIVNNKNTLAVYPGSVRRENSESASFSIGKPKTKMEISNSSDSSNPHFRPSGNEGADETETKASRIQNSMFLRDSRIEIAGGRELYSQSRNRIGRRTKEQQVRMLPGPKEVRDTNMPPEEESPLQENEDSSVWEPHGNEHDSNILQTEMRNSCGGNQGHVLPQGNRQNRPISSRHSIPGYSYTDYGSGSKNIIGRSNSSSHPPRKSKTSSTEVPRGAFPQVHSTPITIKETVFGSEITSIEKSILGEESRLASSKYKTMKVNDDHEGEGAQPFIYETTLSTRCGGEIVFDDIDEQELEREQHRSTQLHILRSIMKESCHEKESEQGRTTNDDDDNTCTFGGYVSDECSASATNEKSLTPNANKRLIGTLPIADYERSPKRYGLNNRQIDSSSCSDSSFGKQQQQQHPRVASSPTNLIPRVPGFPQRICQESELTNLPSAPLSSQQQGEYPKYLITDSIKPGELDESKLDNEIEQDFTRSNSNDQQNATKLNHDTNTSATTSNNHDVNTEISLRTQPVLNNNNENQVIEGEVQQYQPSLPIQQEHNNDPYLYEFSETKKVLEEFFKAGGAVGTAYNTSSIQSDEVDYILKRQTGNSYVGQRLAGEVSLVEESPKLPPRRGGREVVMSVDITPKDPSLNNTTGNGSSLRLITFHEVSRTSMSPTSLSSQQGDLNRDVNDNDIETASTNTETDLGETEVGLHVGHNRNFTMSPEATDCDSNELESEMSLDYEASVHSSCRVGATMPILEDGLSSGNISEAEDDNTTIRKKKSGPILLSQTSPPTKSNITTTSVPPSSNMASHNNTDSVSNPTVLLMKKQISEIEKEIRMRASQHLQPNGGITVGSAGIINTQIQQSQPCDILCTTTSKQTSSICPPQTLVTSSEGDPSTSGFDSNDPELEALDPMRPTPPPSPAPGSSTNFGCARTATGVPVGNAAKKTSAAINGLPENSKPDSDTVSAALKDIKEAIQKTKHLPASHQIARFESDSAKQTAHSISSQATQDKNSSPIWVPRKSSLTGAASHRHEQSNHSSAADSRLREPLLRKPPYEEPVPDDVSDADTDQETDRLLGQNRTDDDYGFYDEKEKDGTKKKRSKEDLLKNPTVLIEGVLFRARYLGSTQLDCEGQPTKATRMIQAEEAVSRIKPAAEESNQKMENTTTDESSIPSSKPVNNNSHNNIPVAKKKEESCIGCEYEDYLYALGGDESEDDSYEEYYGRKSIGNRLGLKIPDNNKKLDGRCNSLTLHDPLNSSTSSSSSSNAGVRSQRANSCGNVSLSKLASASPTGSAASPSTKIMNSITKCVQQPMLPFHLSPPCGSALPGTMFHLRFVGSLEVEEEAGLGKKRRKRPKKTMVEEAVTKLKAPEGETQPSTEVDLFISTEKIMVLNTDLKEIMMDHALRTISYIADIGDLVVLMARRRPIPTDTPDEPNKLPRPPKMICHVFESDEAQYIAQSIGQAFQVAYMEFLKANGIEDHSFVREMDYQEVLNSQEIFGDELQMFAKKELQKDVVVPKTKGEILGVVIVESGWGSMLPTVVIANLAPAGAAARCGQLNIGDQIIAINGVSLVGLPLSTCQNYIKNSKNQTVVKLTVVPCPPVVEVKIKRPDTKYQLGFSVQNGVICSLLRGGIAERGGVRVGHRIIEINNQSVVAVPHEKIVNLLATSVGEINMKTMPTSMFRLLTGQETPLYI